MCEFISWIEYKGEILFLTDDELETKEGKDLKKYLGSSYYTDIVGHGAIVAYYVGIAKGRWWDGFDEYECKEQILIGKIQTTEDNNYE